MQQLFDNNIRVLVIILNSVFVRLMFYKQWLWLVCVCVTYVALYKCHHKLQTVIKS